MKAECMDGGMDGWMGESGQDKTDLVIRWTSEIPRCPNPAIGENGLEGFRRMGEREEEGTEAEEEEEGSGGGSPAILSRHVTDDPRLGGPVGTITNQSNRFKRWERASKKERKKQKENQFHHSRRR